MKNFLRVITIAICLCSANTQAQVVNICTNPAAQQVLLGMYNPSTYTATTVLNHPDTISQGILARVSPDSMRAYLNALSAYQTRNSGSDTASSIRGIGAARRWAYAKFQQFSAQNENRLLASYLQFDTTICGITQHKNIFAVLPGTDTTDKSIIIIEAHIDSRCAGLCDTACAAQGMEDNGSGTALVMELARVMSKYSFDHTIVFLLVIGEEQGLLGGQAFAKFCQVNGVQVKAVLNNDVIGGIICGHTSSPPSCPGHNQVDSTHVRFFSFGGFNSPHKQLSRYIKLEYKEMIQPFATVPMGINIMTPEDRTGRGGDHIPFRHLNYTAMRFTSQNEAGDANVSASGYADRQHTSRDSLGIDINADGILDTLYVDFNYLARNAVINGNAAGMIGISPAVPDFNLSTYPGNLFVAITAHPEYLHYRVGVRTTTNDWDSVYTFTGTTSTNIEVPAGNYIVSVASVDDKGVESLFSREITATVIPVNGVPAINRTNKPIELLQNKPNPADEATMISVMVNEKVNYKEAYISIRDLNGKEVNRKNITLENGINEIMYEHGYDMNGTFIYSLVIDGQVIESKRMAFAN
ncbi:MAG: putative aminopeptidase [Flavipsychrobacter sp.]|jgi:hypothetical protein|nr:putative aminopeptidase [Flavipsychrobacter sp.]